MNSLNISQLRNLWLRAPEDRLADWRKFRLELQEVYKADNVDNVDNVLSHVIHFINTWWSAAPMVNISIDPYASASWPTIWEIIQMGECCKYSKALAMAYNLFYIAPDIGIKIYQVHNNKINDMYLIAVVDDTFVFNYNAEVSLLSEIIEHISVIEQWDITDILIHR